jgi:colanic acid biosynthesis glycosyl transferase WcaI
VKVLLMNQFFAPSPAPTGQLLADVAREIAARGHSATVVCATAAPSTASVRILHTPCTRFSRGCRGRLLSYASFYLGALWRGLCASGTDVVVTMTTPPLLCLIGTLLKGLRGVRHYIWEMDVYPDIAEAVGVLAPGSVLTRAIGALADYSRRKADGVIALGPCMRERLIARSVPAGRIRTVENWADGALIRPRPFPPPEPFVLLYSGNLGLAHDADTIAAAMDRLKDDARFRFVFAGGGSRRAALETFCRSRGISNTLWMPYQSQEDLSAHLAACHVGLVTQAPASFGAVVPSKLYALMAGGRPVLFIGPRQATPALVIEKFRCGWQIDPGDSSALTDLLRLLAASPQLAQEAGVRAREAFVARYDLPVGVSGILDAIELAPPPGGCFTPETHQRLARLS